MQDWFSSHEMRVMERTSKQGMDFEATAAALINERQGASSTVRTAAAVEAGRYI
jgi:hypothetical protein